MAGKESTFTVLLGALEALTLEHFQEFKTKLSHAENKGGWNIHGDELEKVTHPSTLISYMGDSYGEDAAADIAVELLEEMNQRDLAEKILDEKVKGYKQKYREHVAREFLQYKEVNACLGEDVSVSDRYTTLTMARKSWSQCRDEPGDVSSDTVTTQSLFERSEDGQVPRVVVLVGAPGMGKTMTVRKVMTEWVEGALCTQFDYVFCVDCEELSFSKEVSMADLISDCCPQQRTPAGRVWGNPEKILFIFDSFEALRLPLAQPKDELSADPTEAKPLETTLLSLLKGTVLPESSVLIATRPAALQSLTQCLERECYVEILGFSPAAREEYFHRFFGSDNKADTAFRFTRGNEVLYSLCVIPVVSWTVCTVLKQELHERNQLLECSKSTTQMIVFYVSWLLKRRGSSAWQNPQQFLHKLCSLAADGIWKHKVLFEEKEIEDRGLNQPELLSLFLNEKGTAHGNVYSFSHLHLQEFFAAMFYALEDQEETVSGSGSLAKDVKALLESYHASRTDLNVTVWLLFGLMNPESAEYAAEGIGCSISLRPREDLRRWLQTRHLSHRRDATSVEELDTFHFLSETNEESFARSVLGSFTAIALRDAKLTLHDQVALCFCIEQWAGLLSVTLRSCSFQQQRGRQEPATGLPRQSRRQEELRSPLYPLCQALGHPGSSLRSLSLQWCGLTQGDSEALGTLLATLPSLTRLELGDGALGDDGVRTLCAGLRQPGCQLHVLRLRYTRLTSACCQELAAALRTNTCLEELDLSFNAGLRDDGVKLLCEGLQRSGCQLRALRLGSCGLSGACCRALAAWLGETTTLKCLDLSDTELGAGAAPLLRQLRQHDGALQALGLSASTLSEDAVRELAALRELRPGLKIAELLEHEAPEAGAMSAPLHRGGAHLPPPGGAAGRHPGSGRSGRRAAEAADDGGAAAGGRRAQGRAAGGQRAAARLPRRHQGHLPLPDAAVRARRGGAGRQPGAGQAHGADRRQEVQAARVGGRAAHHAARGARPLPLRHQARGAVPAGGQEPAQHRGREGPPGGAAALLQHRAAARALLAGIPRPGRAAEEPPAPHLRHRGAEGGGARLLPAGPLGHDGRGEAAGRAPDPPGGQRAVPAGQGAGGGHQVLRRHRLPQEPADEGAARLSGLDRAGPEDHPAAVELLPVQAAVRGVLRGAGPLLLHPQQVRGQHQSLLQAGQSPRGRVERGRGTGRLRQGAGVGPLSTPRGQQGAAQPGGAPAREGCRGQDPLQGHLLAVEPAALPGPGSVRYSTCGMVNPCLLTFNTPVVGRRAGSRRGVGRWCGSRR